MYMLDAETCRLAREVFEEAAAGLPTKMRSQKQKILLATALLNCAASGETDRERLRSVAAQTVRRLGFTCYTSFQKN
jgi:hypothetical protein